MKKFTKSLLVCLLALFCVVGLTGCNKSKQELEEAKGQIEELKNQLAAAEAQKTELENVKAQLAQLQQDKEQADANYKVLEAAKAELAGDIDNYKAALLEALKAAYLAEGCNYSIEIANADALFGATDADGNYYANVNETYKLDVKLTYTYTPAGATEPAIELTFDVDPSSYVVDYLFASTFDYNRGLKFSAETGLEFALKGAYYVAVFMNTEFENYVPFETLDSEEFDKAAFQASDNYMAAYNLAAYGVGNGALLSVVASDAVQVGFGEAYEAIVECEPGAELQVTVSEGYSLVSATSSDAAIATVDAAGKVTAVKDGTATITVEVKNDADETVVRKVLLGVKVVSKVATELTAGGSEGAYFDFKYASVETQSKILAYMERALINSGASIPVYNNSGLVIYSERVNFIADNYVANMGYGATSVAPDTGKGAGTAKDPAYRMWTSADPSTLNHLNYADSVESDFLTMTAGQLIAFDWKLDENGKGIGWEIKPEMLAVLPYPVEQNEAGEWVKVENFSGLNQYTTWKFDLRTDLKWGNGDDMDANDFIYTYKLVLDPVLNMKRANYFYGGGAPIKGAKDYFEGKTTDWESVGIKQVNDDSFVFEYANPLKLWDVEYNMSGFLYTPVHKATWEANISADGTPQYGSSKDSYVSSGAYNISYWEKGKEYRFSKNENYFIWNEAAETTLLRPCYENYSYVIVKDSNAALQLFKDGTLDVTSVPASAYDEFKDYPSQKFSPGATSFRLSVNRMTQAELDAEFGAGAWDAKEILQEDDFMWALYFGMDRAGVQAITKTSTAWASYFTDAYSIVSPTEDGVDSVTYRQSEWGQKVYTGLDDLDLDLLYDDLGYAPAAATEYYIQALDSMVEKGIFDPSKPYTVEIEIAAFDGATTEAVYAYVAQKYNELFNNDAVKDAYPNVTFEATFIPQPGMDVYYVKQMTGQYDLALAGISGGTMEPAGFMECFCDDNRSGLLLSLGFDSHNANILIDLDLDGDGELDGAKYWSFDALYSALMGKTFVKEGMEAEAPEEAE